MYTVDIKDVKKLRETSGAGLASCKEALEVSQGNFEKALLYLREKGMAKFIKRQSKVALNGVLGTYKHNDGLLCVVLLSCETDFAANNDLFKNLADDIALHVVASNTLFIDREDVPDDFFGEYFGNKISTVTDLDLNKMYSEVCLMDQKFFFDSSKTVKDVISELVARLGEKVEVKYIYKFDIKNGVHISVRKGS